MCFLLTAKNITDGEFFSNTREGSRGFDRLQAMKGEGRQPNQAQTDKDETIYEIYSGNCFISSRSQNDPVALHHQPQIMIIISCGFLPRSEHDPQYK